MMVPCQLSRDHTTTHLLTENPNHVRKDGRFFSLPNITNYNQSSSVCFYYTYSNILDQTEYIIDGRLACCASRRSGVRIPIRNKPAFISKKN